MNLLLNKTRLADLVACGVVWGSPSVQITGEHRSDD